MSSTSPEESPPSDSGESSNSPPPPPPPSDSSSSSTSPPPPSDNSSSSTPPPPPPQSSSSPPPPSDNDSSSPPPPPPKSPPPPPPPDKNSSPSNGNNNNNNNNDNDNDNDNDNGNNNNNNNNNKKYPPPPSNGNSGRHPPPPPRLPSSGSSNDDQKAVIAGAAAGAGLLLLIMIVFLVSCGKRKKRKHRDHMNFYTDNSHGNRNSDYYDMPPHNNWQHSGNLSGGMAKPSPPPPGSAGVSSEHNWMVGPPPPPPMMSSSEMSSAGFSGPHQAALPPPHPAVALGFNQSSFTYNDLAAATGGFAQQYLLGQGGFGYVHKGVLPNGKEIAVKSLKANSGQGEREFQAEVDIISRVHHRHLVSLVGYCIAGAQRMLVYEYVSNGTLEYHLHGAGRPVMDWTTRLKIALGSAKGFAYLHEDCHPRIIHRDIKTANILLDENFEAKVADFGLAKLSSDNNTHVSTRIMGTFGYLAPEYASSGKLTEKSDVYSYGIMLLELITGRRPIDISRDDDDDTLVDWARPIMIKVAEGGSYEEFVDPRLEGNFDPHEMLRMIYSAAACVRQSARRRPKMSQVVRALEGDVSLDDLSEGVKPVLSSSSSDYDLKRYNRNGGPMSSQEFTSSEYTHSSGGNSQEINRSNPANRVGRTP
ncbi:hypothetical protein ABFS83_14G112600 [Erythranthe nasuta]